MREVIVTRGKPGAQQRYRDPCGGVFAPAPGANRPLNLVIGPSSKMADVIFTCPVSAIPPEVFELLELWWACRLNRTLPVAGGWLDQPLIVRRAFPIFEGEYLALEATRQSQTQTANTVAMVRAMFGGK